MAEGSRGRKAPWAAFGAVVLVLIIVAAAFLVWQAGSAVGPEDADIDIGIPAAPSLPPITPTPDPQPLPLPGKPTPR